MSDPVSSEAGQLGVVLRWVQWELDDAAHRLPSGRFTAAEREALADLLEALGGALRAYPTTGSTNTTISVLRETRRGNGSLSI